MDCVRKIDPTGAFWQLHNGAFGREHIDLVGEQVDFNTLNKFKRVARCLLHLKKTLNPFACPHLRNVDIVLMALIQPMRSDAVIRHVFHITCTNLNFYRYAVHAL